MSAVHFGSKFLHHVWFREFAYYFRPFVNPCSAIGLHNRFLRNRCYAVHSKPDRATVVLSFGKQHAERDLGKCFETRFVSFIKQLHILFNVNFLDVRQPTSKAGVRDML